MKQPSVRRGRVSKERGFLEFKRKEPGYREVKERLKDFNAVELRLNDEEILEQAARCMDCGTPFCHGCGCPLMNVIPELNDLVYRKRWREALDILLSTNNFPEFTARVCPALCEASCVLGINDDPVSIRHLELAIIEKGFERGYIKARPPKTRIGKKVAIMGSGPSGLAVADTLNRAGCDVTVYDRAGSAGGVLKYGIPNFKLEKWVVDRRIKLMEEEGVIFELGVSVGDDISYDFLRDKFDAICLACGSRESRDLNVPGRELGGIHFAMDYLTCQNKKNAGENVLRGEDIDARDKTVVVIGGGDTGSDCLGTALRQGASKVHQFEIMPKPPADRPDSTPWPMWPNILRESSSHGEGGRRRWCINTREFLGDKNQVTGLRCVEVEWTRGADGRMQFHEKDDTEFQVDAQLVLLALGFTGPGKNKLADDLGIKRDERGNISVDKNHMTDVDGIFAAGDMAKGQSLVVRAIADGREAAHGILNFF